MFQPRTLKFFALIIGAYLLLLTPGVIWSAYFESPARYLLLLPYFSVSLFHAIGVPGLLEHNGLCGWGWCSPTPFGWLFTALAWLLSAWCLAWAMAALTLRSSRFARNIAPYVDAEIRLARDAERANNEALAFSHLERAHVLGQASTWQHVQVHMQMLAWGFRHRQPREVVGQVPRLIGAATKTAIGLVPNGNTGGSNVSALRPMPVPEELASIIRKAMS